MRYVCLVTSMLVALPAMGQVANDLTIINYRYVGEVRRVSASVSEYEYGADVTNAGPARASLVAMIVGSAPNIVPLLGVLRFGVVPSNGIATSTNTIVLRVDRSLPFDINSMVWSFSNTMAPVAVAGPNQTVAVSATVYLNGSGSTTPPGTGGLTYSWAFTQRPLQSAAILVNPTSVSPTFVADSGMPVPARVQVRRCNQRVPECTTP